MIQEITGGNTYNPITALPMVHNDEVWGRLQLEQLQLALKIEPEQFLRGLAQKFHAVNEHAVISELKRLTKIIFSLGEGEFGSSIAKDAQQLAGSFMAIHNQPEIDPILEEKVVQQICIVFQEYLIVLLYVTMFKAYLYNVFFMEKGNGKGFSLDKHIDTIFMYYNFGGEDRLSRLEPNIACTMYRFEKLFKGIYGADFQNYLERYISYKTLWGGAAKLLNFIVTKDRNERREACDFFVFVRSMFGEGINFSFFKGLGKLEIFYWPETLIPFESEAAKDQCYREYFAACREIQRKEDWLKIRNDFEKRLHVFCSKSKLKKEDLRATLDAFFMDLEKAQEMLNDGGNSRILEKIKDKIRLPFFSEAAERNELLGDFIQFYAWTVLKQCQRLSPEAWQMLFDVDADNPDFLTSEDIRREIEEIIARIPMDYEVTEWDELTPMGSETVLVEEKIEEKSETISQRDVIGYDALDFKLLSYWNNIKFFSKLLFGGEAEIDDAVVDTYKAFWDFSAFLFINCAHKKGINNYNHLLESGRQPLGLLTNLIVQRDWDIPLKF